MTGFWRYCGPPGRGIGMQVLDWTLGGATPNWPQFGGSRVELTYRCRTAIRLVLDSWGVGRGHQVLMPAYHCGTEVDAVAACGAAVVLYRVGRDLRIDEQDVLGRITAQTRVVYVTHYFGWPQRLEQLAARCRAAGIQLLEDCALSLFSGETATGSFGDAAVFSLTKTLGITDGGAAIWRRPDESSPVMRQWPIGATAWRSLQLAKRNAVRALSRVGLRAAFPRPTRPITTTGVGSPMPAGYYFDTGDRGRRISRGALSAAARTSPLQIVGARRRNYGRLSARLQAGGVMPMCESLPEGVCPLVLPLFVPDRDRLVATLQNRGIDAIAWWSGYHRSFDLAGFDDARYLKDHLAALPVHQNLSDVDIDFIASCTLATVAGSSLQANPTNRAGRSHPDGPSVAIERPDPVVAGQP